MIGIWVRFNRYAVVFAEVRLIVCSFLAKITDRSGARRLINGQFVKFARLMKFLSPVCKPIKAFRCLWMVCTWNEDARDARSSESRANHRVDDHCANDSVTSHSCKVPVHFFHRLRFHSLSRARARVQPCAVWCAWLLTWFLLHRTLCASFVPSYRSCGESLYGVEYHWGKASILWSIETFHAGRNIFSA